MILRPRQAQLVERTLAALERHGNTLAVAPTGSGKTIMLAAVAGRLLAEPAAKACILAHRGELIDQNRAKFSRVNPQLSTSVVDANAKSWAGHATFAMVQTLARASNLAQLPTLDLLVIDEAHHAASPTYRTVVDTVLARNPRARICGLTATPNRGDGKGLRAVFSNVADQITLGEMIAAGHLVPPRTFVIDAGVQAALKKVRRTAIDFDMDEVAAILNRPLITAAVISHWQNQARGRKTIVFCSTVDHAQNVTAAFVAAGVPAVLVHGELPEPVRKARLAAYEKGTAQVVVNVAVLTEGYDYTPTACVVLLRPSSHKSTFIQMVGRGLRVVDPEEFPGVVKTDFWNASRNRPAEFGGPVEAAKEIKAIMERGKDALEIGRQAVAGVERGDFYIVTHPHARGYVEKRYHEILAAFDAQAPYQAGEERYDVTTIALEVIAGMKV